MNKYYRSYRDPRCEMKSSKWWFLLAPLVGCAYAFVLICWWFL